jgi:RNA polymerase sigma-70 factor (ECF subfamily)
MGYIGNTLSESNEKQLSDPFSSLMRQAQDGNQGAYAELLKSLLNPIKSFLLHHFSGIRDVDDVIQESLITLHKVRHTYDPSRPFMPWLYAIVRHRALDYLRKNIRIQSRELYEERTLDTAAAPENIESPDSLEIVAEMLAILPEKEQAVVRMLKIDQLSVKDVAERLGLSESNVKVIASRSYGKLRTRWKDKRAN